MCSIKQLGRHSSRNNLHASSGLRFYGHLRGPENRPDLLKRNGRKIHEEFLHRAAAHEVIEEIPERHPRPSEHGRADEDLGISYDFAATLYSRSAQSLSFFSATSTF